MSIFRTTSGIAGGNTVLISFSTSGKINNILSTHLIAASYSSKGIFKFLAFVFSYLKVEKDTYNPNIETGLLKL